ncbi:hypothetical protein Anas_01161 [Armadillidium nasatum]|uniref:Kynurenine formamidase n=1 Tax=Armadillidium nasatum TaxID=96803 RepID=A0A5N5STV3_9CRUS|nr:hypothetical protein Anas_01161 [Armadillidium nasatum]
MIILTLFTIVNLINYSTQTFVDLGHELRHDVPIYPIPGYLNNRFTLTAIANETTPKGFWIAYSKFQDPLAYLGDVTDMTKLRFPGFGADSIRRILNFKSSHKIDVVGFGIDTMSLDHGPSQEFESHQIVQGENLYIIENMNNLEALPLTGSKIFVMPMKIVGGTGAPTRVIAELPSTEEVSTEEVTTSDPPIDESSSILDTTETISVESSKSSPTDDESAISSSSVTTLDSSTTTTTAPEASSPDEVLNEKVDDN